MTKRKVEKHYTKAEEQEILSKHLTKQGGIKVRSIGTTKNGMYYTYLPNRKQLKFSSKDKLLAALEKYYQLEGANLSDDYNIYQLVKASLKYYLSKGYIAEGTYRRNMTLAKMMFEGDEQYKLSIISKNASDLEGFDIAEYLNALIIAKKLSKKAYMNCKAVLTKAFKYGRSNKLLNINYEAFFNDLPNYNRILNKKAKADEEQVFDKEEMKKLMNELRFNLSEESRQRSLLRFAVMLVALFGLRPGEATALRYSDFSFVYKKKASAQELNLYTAGKYPNPYLKYEFEDGREASEPGSGFMFYYVGDYEEKLNQPTTYCELSITKSEKGRVITDATKTGNDRKIRVSDPYLDRVFFWSVLRNDTDPDDYIFRERGACVYSEDISKELKKLCEKIGIPPTRSATALRKTFCMNLLDKGANDSELIAFMGHMDIKTTRNFYMRLKATSDEKYERAMELSPFNS